MKPLRDWRGGLPEAGPLAPVPGRGGAPTVQADGVYLHSRYRPEEEAQSFVESAALDPERPVFVFGLGLGYHVAELLRRGFDVAVFEPDLRMVRACLDAGVLDAPDLLLAAGDADAAAKDPAFASFAKRLPQVLFHPPTVRLYDAAAGAFRHHSVALGLRHERLGVAVVGPMYGGSLEIAQYLERAFARLGHRTLFVDNAEGYRLYEQVRSSIDFPTAKNQLTGMLVNFLGEWSYARVMDFMPDVCIVMAQAPVNAAFPHRLRKEGIVSAYWFVENWRHMAYWRDIAPLYDSFFHIQPGVFEQMLDDVGCPHHAFVQTACDPEVHRPIDLTEAERAEYGADVAFAGAGYPNRQHMLAGLTDYRLKIWGTDWTKRELGPFIQRDGARFTTEDFLKIVAASKINLNLHASTAHQGIDPGADALNPRVFEIAACGGFQVCDPCKGLGGFFDLENELPVYRNLAELRALIDHYLAHPDERAACARRMRERVLGAHTYEHRANQMLDTLLDAHGARILGKGIRVQRTMAEMAEEAGRDTPLGAFLATLPPDALFTHEQVNELLTRDREQGSEPERVFMYLQEVRSYAEGLLGWTRQ